MRMGMKSKALLPCCKKYGLPIYCASWVPMQQIREKMQKEDSGEGKGNEVESLIQHCSTMALRSLVLGGGGGEGRSGLTNALLLTQFDFSSASLHEEPVNKIETDDEVPYRMAVHPWGEGLICSFPNGCRVYEWDVPEGMELEKLSLKPSEQTVAQLGDVGLQLALAFNSSGSLLAAGGEDGCLRIFKWPKMEIIRNQTDAHASVKDLDFSQNGKFLVTVGGSGPCRVWDLNSTVVVNLPRQNGEMFGFCRFSRGSEDSQILYASSMQGLHGCIVSWDTNSWIRTGSKKFTKDPISAFNVSLDGTLLAIGTVEGDITIVNSFNMEVKTTVRKAHLGLVTAVDFSHDSRAAVSTSFDSSARVTVIEDGKQNGFNMWVIIFVVILAIVVYFLKGKISLSDVYIKWKQRAS